ncbi:aspartic proteinase CDR1-like [Cornus florida]|uniref:aspartic proteinase CDR1-like n=1 Tax=Cornus florida TaxID=4283 RepID=UPI0028A0A1E6|nr:aspartic proteinase CDR1-like [Cornus florida]
MATSVTSHSLSSIALVSTVSIISLSTFSLIEASNCLWPSGTKPLLPKGRSVVQTSLEIITANGEYLMKISSGTPPVEALAIADSGSDLIWIQCEPCNDYYMQKAPLFNPKNSFTFKEVSCHSNQCHPLKEPLAKQVMEVDSSQCHMAICPTVMAFLPPILMNGSGIAGLGGGHVSLISQLRSSIGGKFSYCLVPSIPQLSKSSKLNFGDNGVVSGAGVVSNPLVPKPPVTFYYLTLLESAVKKAIPLEHVDGPEQLNLCYMTEEDIDLPIITAHFKGADVKLNPLNTFVRTSESGVCFAFAQSENVAIFGNLAQMNFLVGDDLQKKTVSFKPTSCGQQ